MNKILTYLIIFLAVILPVSAYSADASINSVVVTERPDLRISFSVKDAFTQDIEDAIKSGMPTVFTYIISVRRIRGVWFNEDIGNYTFTHAVKYDILRDEYELTIDEAAVKTVKVADFGDMSRLMVSVDGVGVLNGSPLLPGRTYEIRIRAKLHTVELPGMLNSMFFFVRLWDYETDWYTYRFTL